MKQAALLFLSIILFACNRPSHQDAIKDVSANDLEAAFQQHLDHFYPAVIDSTNGGYYTNFEYDWSRSNDQDKMIVTQARDLWMASAAAQAFPENMQYRKAAEHGYKFLTSAMWDKVRGGFHLNYSAEHPNEHSPYKLIYGHAFALFALAEYAKIDTCSEVKDWLNKSFYWMEMNAHDSIAGGYYNVILNDELKTDTPENRNFIQKMGWGDPSWKDQNTSIHILEAFTTLYKVMPTSEVKNRLKEMLILVRDTMVQDNGSLKLYFTHDWKAISHSDSTREFILKNQGTDHVSFGHNIETAYLIIDASISLDKQADSTTLKVAKKLTDHTLKYGFDEHYYGLYDRGYVFNNQMEIIDQRKSWWAQYEAWHTLALLSHFFPNDTIYPFAFKNMWQYINLELVDSTYGGQYNFGIDESPNNTKQRKAHAWKGPYHDGRALLRVWEYLKNGQLKIDE